MSNVNPIPLGAETALQTWLDDPEIQSNLAASRWKEAYASYKYLEIHEPPAFALFQKPLKEATLAVITSGGLYIDGQQIPFNAADPLGDPSIRLLPTATPYASLKIAHDHYDHTVPEQDLGTVNPVRNLEALVGEGFLGQVHSPQISFSGYLPIWTKVLDPLIPAVLAELRDKPIDGVLLVPV